MRRALGHVPLEAVAEKNTDLPAAINRPRFVEDVASAQIQTRDPKVRVIEGVQEFAANQNLLSLQVVHGNLERALNGKVVVLEAWRDKGVSADIPQPTGRNQEVETRCRTGNASRCPVYAIVSIRTKECAWCCCEAQLGSVNADGG